MAEPLKPGDPERLGAYDLVGRLGEGGQGVVFEGRGPEGERVAVKLLRAQLSGDPTARSRFVREIEAAERVAGFCTAQVLDADAEGDQPYIVSEFVEGRSLQQLVLEDGPRSGGDLHRLAIGTATALAAIHQAGIVHRDFKPPNVLMGPDGPRVIDFGIARALDGTGTMTSHVVGTPAYMAPEQVAGAALGPHTDVFAWGATLVFAATGRTPFGSDTIPAVMHRILHGEPDLSALPAPLAGLVAACLNKNPAYRPTSAQLVFSLLGHQGAAPAVAGTTAVEPFLEQGAGMATGKITPPPLPPVQIAASPPPGQVPFQPPIPPPPSPAPPAMAAAPQAHGNPALTVVAVSLATLALGLGLYWSQTLLPLRSDPGMRFWLGVSYPAVLAMALVPMGRVADSIGRKKVFLGGLGGFAVASVLQTVLFGAVPGIAGGWFNVVPRVLMGLCAAAVSATGVALLREAFPGRSFAFPIGIWGAVAGMPAVLGSVVVSLFDGGGNWIVSLAVLPFVMLAFLIGVIGTRDSRHSGPGRAVDIPGAALMGLFGLSLIFGVWSGDANGWTDWRTLAGLVIGAVSLLALVVVQLALRPALFSPRLAATVLAGVAVFGAYYVYDRALFEANIVNSATRGGQWFGLRLIPTMVGALVAAPLTGLVISKAGVRRPLAVAPVTLALSALGAMVMLDADMPYPVVALLLLMEGVAMGMLTVALAVAIVGDPPDGLTGFGGGLQELIQSMGAQFAILLLLLGEARDYGGGASTRVSNLDEVFRIPLLIAVLVALLAAVVFAMIRRPDLEPAERRHPAAQPGPLGGPAHPGLAAPQPGQPQASSPAYYAGTEPPRAE
ncbi:bifunctional serine/threonine protein kinase/MFS transporter [Actinomadura rudentiformis]|uniref:MFS transporter n=1 Tax=Actinomadura rudentiformis TaxID=359158 RepID=A0A6H9YKS9_9ACTN|nr:bifunctional serine/threonine protein kinase/MFS transporter [Actinomadura rudentiformis]KAB2341777.1 MFS transporter [Actinomadura rudentiformis]